MTNKIEIGINQRIPISLLEMALLAALEGQGTPEYFAELAGTEYQGENRIRKSTYVMGRLTNRNPLMPFLQENKDAVISALRSKTGAGTETVSIFGCIVFTPLLLLAVLYAENGVRALLRRRQAKRKKPVPMHKKQQKKQALQAEALSARYAPVNVGAVMDLLTPGIFIILACVSLIQVRISNKKEVEL